MPIHVVRGGESLSEIARRERVSAQALAEINALSEGDALVPGLALLIPGRAGKERREIVVNGFAYPSLPLSKAGASLAALSSFCSLSCRLTPWGSLIAQDDRALLRAARAAGAAPLLCLSNIGERGGFSGELCHALFSEPEAQSALLSELAALCAERACAGVCFHFQYIYPFDRERCRAFLRRAAEELHSRGLRLMCTLAPKESEHQGGILYGAQDYAACGACADYLVLLCCDWGHPYSEPRSIAPLRKVRAVLDYALGCVAPEKLLLAISSYGCNWTMPFSCGSAAEPISASAAVKLAMAAHVPIRFDERDAAAFFRYLDEAGQAHEIWFDELRGMLARMELARAYGLGGISYWTLGTLPRPALALQEALFTAIKAI